MTGEITNCQVGARTEISRIFYRQVTTQGGRNRLYAIMNTMTIIISVTIMTNVTNMTIMSTMTMIHDQRDQYVHYTGSQKPFLEFPKMPGSFMLHFDR